MGRPATGTPEPDAPDATASLGARSAGSGLGRQKCFHRLKSFAAVPERRTWGRQPQVRSGGGVFPAKGGSLTAAVRSSSLRKPGRETAPALSLRALSVLMEPCPPCRFSQPPVSSVNARKGGAAYQADFLNGHFDFLRRAFDAATHLTIQIPYWICRTFGENLSDRLVVEVLADLLFCTTAIKAPTSSSFYFNLKPAINLIHFTR